MIKRHFGTRFVFPEQEQALKCRVPIVSKVCHQEQQSKHQPFFGVRFALKLIGRAIRWNESRNKHPRNWPAVQGKVTSVKFDEYTPYGEGFSQIGPTTYYETVRFTYEVEGVRYSGKRTSSFERVPGKGTAVTVYYNPEKPKQAVVIDPMVFSLRGRLIALVLSAAFLLIIPAVTGAVIWAIITIWIGAESQPW